MKLKLNSLSAKLGLFYIFLAFVNISFFSLMIYENQIDLIKENTRLKAIKLNNNIINSITEISRKYSQNENKMELGDEYKKIEGILSKFIKSYVIFSEKGQIIIQKNINEINNEDIISGVKAIASKEFSGLPYYVKFKEDLFRLKFYVPLKLTKSDQNILLYYYQLKDINKDLSYLYRLITLMIGLIILFHIIVGFFLYRLFIKPVKKLHNQSQAIEKGDLTARVNIKHNDELGQLGKSFNHMADSIQGQILQLKDKNSTLQKQKEEIEVFNKNMEEVLALVAHDLRNPIGSISMVAQHLQENIRKEDLELFNYIQKGCDSSIAIIEDLIQITQLEVAHELPFERMNLTDVLNLAAQNNYLKLNNKEIELIKDFDESLTIELVPSKFVRLIENLISNAIKFSQHKGIIKIKSFQDEQHIFIKIQDFGTGISEEQLQHLFEKFTRFRKEGTAGEKSIGLGLYIVKQIVEQHHGEISVESELGKGTTFTIKLPKN